MTKDPNQKLGKQLNQLGKMLKKRQNTNFEAALREQLMQRAESMNEKKTRRAWSFNFSNLFAQKLAVNRLFASENDRKFNSLLFAK